VRKPDPTSEERLAEIRRQATTTNHQPSTYYDLPLLKPPAWTWEIPAYFFVGGAAGAAAVIGFAARFQERSPKLVRDARWIAAIGSALSLPLLISDLGRPERFLYMLRVFKPKSPMSVGAWIVAAFGGASTAAAVLDGRPADTAAAVSALLGLGMSTYTGVLLGATAIPVWQQHAGVLPVHFGASAVASAASLLELRGNRTGALHYLALTSAGVETLTAVKTPLRSATSRAANLFSGPIPLVLRLFGRRSTRLRRAAAGAALLGSLLTRIAWTEAGRESSRQPTVASFAPAESAVL
jgi:formate-dependent nitrite reductase membrane component NrfD